MLSEECCRNCVLREHTMQSMMLGVDARVLSGCGGPRRAGKFVDLKDTIQGFKGIMEGEHDDLPEMAFYMVGDIAEVKQKADKMARDMAEGK